MLETILTLADGARDEFYGALKDLYDTRLKSRDFLFVHASCLVNYDYVAEVKYDRLLMQRGASLPISQKRRADARRRYATITQKRRLV